MKKYILLTAMAFTLTAPVAAYSQTAPAPNGTPPQSQGGQHSGDSQHFQERKAEILQRMNEHLAEVQKRIGCIQAANDHEALRSCMPERGERHGDWHHGGDHDEGQAPGGAPEEAPSVGPDGDK